MPPTREPADSRRRAPTRTPAAGRSGACTTRAAGERAAASRSPHRRGRAGGGGRDAVGREIPGRVPRVLPLVRHRDDVGVVEVCPLAVPTVLTAGGGLRLRWIAFEPGLHDVVVVLLRPEQSGKRLSRD